jgi:protein TonB
LFDQTFVNAQAQTRRPWTVALSLTLQSSLVAVLLLVPILRVAPLDAPPKVPTWLPVHQVNIQARPEVRPASHTTTARPNIDPTRLVVPRTVPKTIDLTPDAPEIPGPAMSFLSAGSGIDALGSAIKAEPPAVQRPPQQQVVQRPTTPTTPQRVGGSVQAAKLIFGPRPAYPTIAKTTGTQGTVRIEALIGRDGVIRNLHVVSGHPLLVRAAMDAVAQWRYQPTLLNGEAVEVITEIDVNFALSR